jgi:ABC-2 type transport system permease protein
MSAGAAALPQAGVGAGVARTFLAICWRDVFVVVHDFPSFLLQVVVQPLFLAFVFGRILPELSLAQPGFADVLLPGVVGMTVVLTALQGIALPLVLEFGYTKEIEDRLLAPLPTSLVAVEKIVIGALRGLFGGLVVLPLAWLIMGWNAVELSGDHVPAFALFCVLGAVLGSSLGLALGTLVDARRINVMFAFIFTPLLFTGCVQYPWATLDPIRWFQVVTLFNPLTYASEGLRGSLVPQVPHMAGWTAGLVATVWIVAFVALGLHGFRRRAVD